MIGSRLLHTRGGGGAGGGRVLIIVFNGAQNIKPTNSLRPLSSRGAVTEDDGGGGWAQETSDGWMLGPVAANNQYSGAGVM